MGVEALEKWHFRDAWLSNVSLADQRHPTDEDRLQDNCSISLSVVGPLADERLGRRHPLRAKSLRGQWALLMAKVPRER
jgi:hypothetical protein